MPTPDELLEEARRHLRAGRIDPAIASLQQLAQMAPHSAPLRNELGVLLGQQGRYAEAQAQFAEAVRIDPKFVQAQHNLGLSFLRLNETSQGVETLRGVVETAPDFAPAQAELGAGLLRGKKFDEAEPHLRKATELQPGDPLAQFNLARCLVSQGKAQEGVERFGRVAALKDSPGLQIRMAMVLPLIVRSAEDMLAWRERFTGNIERLLQSPPPIADPLVEVATTNFLSAYHGMDDRALQEKLAALHLESCPSLQWTAPHCRDAASRRVRGRRVRIGFISENLRGHTIGKLNVGLIEQLDRRRFEPVALQIGSVDESGEKLAALADRRVRVGGSLGRMREQVASAELDVLFYTDIGMDASTYFLAFSRLAPVQMATWGHPVTSGLRRIDFFLSSENLDTPQAQQHYTERLVRLPRMSVCYTKPEITGKIVGRDHFGLGADWRVYLCPQSLFKVHPDFDPVLARILRDDRAARIVFLHGHSKHWAEALHRRIADQAADLTDRIVFLPRLSMAEFIALFLSADATLDTPHFGGGNTSYEAFAVGAPVVTWPSEFLRGRITYAQYHQMGVTDLIARDLDHYAQLALRLANDPSWRTEMRSKIVAAQDRLFQDVQAVRDFEQFLLRVTGAESQ